MSKVRIVADSTCDLSKELLAKYDISVIPLCVIMGEDSYFDGENITPDELYAWADANKTTPKTAAIPFDKATDVLKPFMEAGDDIIFFGISSKMSTTCNVARIIAEDTPYERLFVIDSENLSTGIGLQVLRAARLASEGKSAEEIVSEIEGERSKVRASFVVDTLTYLARGGRCNAVTALMANTLKLHPVISVKDGSMGVGKKLRGKLEIVLDKYVEEMTDELMMADRERVFITHSGCSEEIIERVKSRLEALGHFDEICITRAGGVISSHCGPNTLGVLYYLS
ncbi:MAG: DegV family protein [Clostridia bacterium]|nr:DegV family protein [Clostridia bacterium]